MCTFLTNYPFIKELGSKRKQLLYEKDMSNDISIQSKKFKSMTGYSEKSVIPFHVL